MKVSNVGCFYVITEEGTWCEMRQKCIDMKADLATGFANGLAVPKDHFKSIYDTVEGLFHIKYKVIEQYVNKHLIFREWHANGKCSLDGNQKINF